MHFAFQIVANEWRSGLNAWRPIQTINAFCIPDSYQRMVQRYRLNTQSLLSNLTCITIAYPHPYLPANVIHATPPLPTHAILVDDVTN